MKPRRYESKHRSELLALLRSTKSHPTAAWLLERLRETIPSISLGTVYRNLGLLVESGEILSLQSESGIDRFDADTSVHYHVQCTDCGRVDDLALPAETERDALAAGASGYLISSHRIFYYGICPGCQKRQLGEKGPVGADTEKNAKAQDANGGRC
jgi:Fe2+ or Zn2+ uptake regulation protein